MSKRPPAPHAAPHAALGALRALTARLPETSEVLAWDHPTFRVRNKIFASFGERDGEPTIGCKQTKLDQAVLLEDPCFFRPAYVGQHGWIGIWVDRAGWGRIEPLVMRSFRLVAPATVVRRLDAGEAEPPAAPRRRKA